MTTLRYKIDQARQNKLKIGIFGFGEEIDDAFDNLGFREKIELLSDFVEAYNKNDLKGLDSLGLRFKEAGPISMTTITPNNQYRMWLRNELPASYQSHHVDSCGKPLIQLVSDIETIERINRGMSLDFVTKEKYILPNGVRIYTGLDLEFEDKEGIYKGRLRK